MEYTGIVDGFQIRDVTYVGKPPKDTPPRYDVVKWVDCAPFGAYDIATGKKVTKTRYCYSVACLEWDRHEGWWQFESVGTRWLDEKPTDAVRDMLLQFCEEKAREIDADE